MKFAAWTVLIVLALAVQSTLAPLLAVNNVWPDLLLIIVISAGLLAGKEIGLGVGFFAGILQDLASGGIIGLGALTKMMLGFAAGTMERKVFKENILLPVAAMGLGTIAYGVLFYGLLAVLGHRTDLVATAVERVAPLAAYNAVAAIPVHHIVYRFMRKLSAYDRD